MNKYIAILLLAFSGSTFAESYLCIADKSTGFKFNPSSKSWEITSFTVGDSKYILSPANENTYKKNAIYDLKIVGEKLGRTWCESDFDEFGTISCKGFAADFNFNKGTGRFLYVFKSGYWTVFPDSKKDFVTKSDKESATPYIEIGKCSPL